MSQPAITKLGSALETACLFSGTVSALTPITLMTKFMAALAGYLGTVTYSGNFIGSVVATPSPIPAAAAVSNGTINSAALATPPPPVCAAYDPSSGNGEPEWKIWMTDIYTRISTMCLTVGTTSAAAVTIATPIPIFANLKLGWSRDDLKDAAERGDNLFDAMADKIIEDLKKAYSGVSYVVTGGTIGGTAIVSGADTITGCEFPR